MSLSSILAQCVTTAGTISGIGVVRDHEMLVTTLDQLKDNFMSGGIFNCLEIDRERTEARWLTNVETERTHLLKFRFYYGVQQGSSSRTAFRTLLEAAESTFRPLADLNGTALISSPFVIDLDGYIMKASALLHYGECSLRVQEVVS